MKLYTVYKLLTRFNGELWSYNVSIPGRTVPKSATNVKYIPGRWTKPTVWKNSPLWAFQTAHAAESFRVSACSEIWSAECSVIRPAPEEWFGRWLCESGFYKEPRQMPDVFKGWRDIDSRLPREAVWRGTVFCDRIRLLEKLT